MLNIPFTGESRLDLINLAIRKSEAKTYLEIGCDKNKIFRNIHVSHKVGVDPARGGTHRMTSDDFFKQNTEKFDVVFIDGLHYYEQVKKDFENSLNCLNDNGFIILHDMMPSTPEEAVVPIPKIMPYTWVGDVWRLAFDLAAREDIVFKLILIDNGCGIAWKGKQNSYSCQVDNNWNYYADNWNKLPVTSFTEIQNTLK